MVCFMFGFLKKRLSDAISKVTKKIEKPAEAAAQKKPAIKKKISEKKPEITRPKKEQIEQAIEEKIEELEELKEEVHEEHIPTDIAEEMAAFEEVKEQQLAKELKKDKKEIREKKGVIGLIRAVNEKKVTESEAQKILQELQIALLENDVALEVADKICNDVKNELVGKNVKRGKLDIAVKDALRNAMLGVLKQDTLDLDAMISKKRPYVIVFFGFNGVGKTTVCAKFAHKFKKYQPVLAAGDTFRAASIEQLEEHGKRLGMKVIKHQYQADSAAVIYDAKRHAESSGAGLVLADTAGRAHSNTNLMDELKKICRVIKPDMKVLVLDSLAGNDIYDQAKLFNDAVGVDAVILTKADVYEKGGATLSAAYTIKRPILYLGMGQEYSDLKEFDPELIVDNLLG
ncbi:MAG: signal recognition particle-docking protein FtsY [Candidatus Aenigmarchaeota archaeon]|nr:signal recognition particle-docking protein FtsY [Candidatus Aenigmarchaeota archaeon]